MGAWAALAQVQCSAETALLLWLRVQSALRTVAGMQVHTLNGLPLPLALLAWQTW